MIGSGAVRSKDVARERLKNMLMRDRVDISPEVMKLLKEDMAALAGEYFKVGEKGSDLYLTEVKKPGEEGYETVLVCLLPVKKLKEV